MIAQNTIPKLLTDRAKGIRMINSRIIGDKNRQPQSHIQQGIEAKKAKRVCKGRAFWALSSVFVVRYIGKKNSQHRIKKRKQTDESKQIEENLMESEFFPRVGIDKLKSPTKLELISNKNKEREKNCSKGSGYAAMLVRPKLQQFREK